MDKSVPRVTGKRYKCSFVRQSRKKWLEDTEKSSCVYVADKIYFNPARSEVTELIVNGVKEIVKNYAVDGIHFDDYFIQPQMRR